MKKFAIIAHIGTHEQINGRAVIDCTVKDVALVIDDNDRNKLVEWLVRETGSACGSTIYADDGRWYSYDLASRKNARQALKMFGKL